MAEVSTPDHAHLLRFYESSTRLATQVADFLAEALASGGTAIAFARAIHLPAIREALRALGHAPEALAAAGSLHLVDAQEQLDAFMDGPHLDNDRFQATIGALIARHARAESRTHVYGEMVDVLWAARNSGAVFELEQLWAELMRTHPVTLLCGYRLGALASGEDVDRVIAFHDEGAPTDRFAMIGSDIATARTLARLEQRAYALEAEVERRTRVEALMNELIELTSELAQARTREDIARLTIDKASRTLGAVAAVLWTVAPDNAHLELLAASEPEYEAAAGHYSRVDLASDVPIVQAVRTGEPIFIGSRAAYAAMYPASWKRMADVLAPNHISFAIVPLLVGEERLGVLCFTYDHERVFDAMGRNFKTIVARNCALALERVQLLAGERAQREAAERAAGAEKQLRGDVELLYELIASFNRIDDIDQVYDLALRSALAVSRSDRAAILVFDPDGVMRFRAQLGLSERFRSAIDGYSPWGTGDAYPAPVIVDDTQTDPTCAAHRELLGAEGIRALAFVPIVHHRRLIGKLTLYRDEPRPYAPRDLQLAATVAVHVAQAVERKQQERELARAYREEREAHYLAEESARAREEILSVVSHDLRNPLGTILMGASTLLHIDAGDRGHRVRTTAERIHRQAERMARLIEDLVDFAGIQAGRLTLECRSHAPAAIIATTTELFMPMAQERGLRLHAEVAPGLPEIRCDSERAVQVLSNLVANALKVTSRGGQIAIGAEQRDHEVVFFVRDTGPGIEPDELPMLFERYWRGKQSSYKGAGLGLSIARGIVDAHGGRIWADSQIGVGSTFYFTLTSNH